MLDKCIVCKKDLIKNPDNIGCYMSCSVNSGLVNSNNTHYWYGLIHKGVRLNIPAARINIKNFSICFDDESIMIIDHLNNNTIEIESSIKLFNSLNSLEAIQNFLLLQ